MRENHLARFFNLLRPQPAIMRFGSQSIAYLIPLSISLVNSDRTAVVAFVSVNYRPCTARASRASPKHLAAVPDGDKSSASKQKGDTTNQRYIDAVVEEKTAGLAELDEENTTVRLCV